MRMFWKAIYLLHSFWCEGYEPICAALTQFYHFSLSSDDVTSHLSSDGVLLVTAPLRNGTAVQRDERRAIQ